MYPQSHLFPSSSTYSRSRYVRQFKVLVELRFPQTTCNVEAISSTSSVSLVSPQLCSRPLQHIALSPSIEMQLLIQIFVILRGMQRRVQLFQNRLISTFLHVNRRDVRVLASVFLVPFLWFPKNKIIVLSDLPMGRERNGLKRS